MIEEINNKGLWALQFGEYEDAEKLFKECIALDNQSPQLHYNLALTWYRKGETDKARTKFNTVVNFDRAFADAWAMIGEIAKEERNYSEASYAWLQAITHEQNSKKKRELWTLRGFNELIQGKIRNGYEMLSNAHEYEGVDPPRWTGDVSLQGKSLLVIGDQGLGDQIFYARWIPWLKTLGAEDINLVVAAPLYRLFRTEFLDRFLHITTQEDLEGAFDYQIKLSDLPLIFQTTLGTVPANPYIECTPSILASGVGLCWAGNPLHRNDKERSIPLKEFAPLFDGTFDGSVEFLSWQQPIKEADKKLFKEFFVNEEADWAFEDMEAAAEAITESSLVISCDTAVANLAGAMGKETWVLVPYSSDWRWMATGDSTIWYPSVKVYRQGEDRQWGPVIDKVKHDLLERLK